ncbi:MAG: hypothetical protein HC868_10470 [Sphingomonadales bacterium]|nr:hypothetical protein [Sphingomonadales bacterium]
MSRSSIIFDLERADLVHAFIDDAATAAAFRQRGFLRADAHVVVAAAAVPVAGLVALADTDLAAVGTDRQVTILAREATGIGDVPLDLLAQAARDADDADQQAKKSQHAECLWQSDRCRRRPTPGMKPRMPASAGETVPPEVAL